MSYTKSEQENLHELLPLRPIELVGIIKFNLDANMSTFYVSSL